MSVLCVCCAALLMERHHGKQNLLQSKMQFCNGCKTLKQLIDSHCNVLHFKKKTSQLFFRYLFHMNQQENCIDNLIALFSEIFFFAHHDKCEKIKCLIKNNPPFRVQYNLNHNSTRRRHNSHTFAASRLGQVRKWRSKKKSSRLSRAPPTQSAANTTQPEFISDFKLQSIKTRLWMTSPAAKPDTLFFYAFFCYEQRRGHFCHTGPGNPIYSKGCQLTVAMFWQKSAELRSKACCCC